MGLSEAHDAIENAVQPGLLFQFSNGGFTDILSRISQALGSMRWFMIWTPTMCKLVCELMTWQQTLSTAVHVCLCDTRIHSKSTSTHLWASSKAFSLQPGQFVPEPPASCPSVDAEPTPQFPLDAWAHAAIATRNAWATISLGRPRQEPRVGNRTPAKLWRGSDATVQWGCESISPASPRRPIFATPW